MSQARVSLLRRSRPYLFVLLAVLCVLGAAVPLTSVPNIPQHFNNGSTGPFVSLTKPNDQSTWPVGTLVSVNAVAGSAKDFQSFELWADGNLLQTRKTTSGSASWSWIMPSAGAHALYIRASDSQGRTVNSNVVRLIGSPSSGPSFDVLTTSGKGDTIASVAQKFGTTADKLVAENTGLNPNAALQPGTPIRVPVQFKQSSSGSGAPTPSPSNPGAGSPQPASLNPPSKYVFWLSKFTVSKLPAAPDVSAKANGCTVDLLITDHSNNESAFRVYRLDPDAQSFKQIRTLGANGNAQLPFLYSDPQVHGLLSYYVTAFNAAGQSSSNIATVNLDDPACLTPYWQGQSLQTQQTFAFAPADSSGLSSTTFDKTYFYLSIDGQARHRFPQDPNAFLDLPNGIFNVDDQIKATVTPPTQGSLHLDLDAWGWKGGALVHIGDFRRTLLAPAVPAVVPPSGAALPNYLYFCEESSGCTDVSTFQGLDVTQDYAKVHFLWNPGQTNTYQGLWQVALIPFMSTCDAPPLDLLATGTAPAGEFFIDFSVFKGKTKPLGNEVIGANGPTHFYIQVLPVVNGTPVCEPSNTLDYEAGGPPPPSVVIPTTAPPPPPAPAPPDAYDVKIDNLSPIQYPNYSYQNCIQVTSNPYYGNVAAAEAAITGSTTIGNITGNDSLAAAVLGAAGSDPLNFLAQFWAAVPPGTTICPTRYTPPDTTILDDIGSALKTMLNGFADLYDELKKLAVELVDVANPFCIQARAVASAANTGSDAVDSACSKFAEVAVDVGLAYVGLPPSIPHYDELANSAEDAAANVAVDELGDNCPDADACRKVVKTGLEEMRQAVQNSMASTSCVDKDEAHALGFEPLCVPDGIGIEQSPLAQLIPAILTVDISRKPDVPQSAFPDPSQFQVSCGFSVHTDGQNDTLVGQSIPIGNDASTGQPDFWQGTPIEGVLFHDVSGKFAPLGIFDTPLTLAFALEPNSVSLPVPGYTDYMGFWLPGALQNAEQAQWQNELSSQTNYSDDWTYLYFGGNAIVSLKGSCTTSGAGYSPASTPFSDTKTFTMPGLPGQ